MRGIKEGYTRKYRILGSLWKIVYRITRERIKGLGFAFRLKCGAVVVELPRLLPPRLRACLPPIEPMSGFLLLGIAIRLLTGLALPLTHWVYRKGQKIWINSLIMHLLHVW